MYESDLEKETNDSHNTFHQTALHYKEGENAFMKNIMSVVYFLFSLLKNEGTDV